MVENRRLYMDVLICSHPVAPFEGTKTYVSTGDSDNMEAGEIVSYAVRPSRANVQARLNDIIFAKMANTDKTFLIDEKLKNYIFSTGFYDISSKKIDSKFLLYLIKSHIFDSYKNAFSEGTTQVSLSNDRFKRIKIPYETNVVKQREIAKYLDSKIESIDSKILKLEHQIDEIEKFKFSIINETLYRYGSSFKNVNKDWIDKIPANWDLCKFKHIFRISKGLGITKENLIDGGLPTISYGQTHNDFYKYEFNPTDNPLRGVDNSYLVYRSSIMKKGDFIFVDTSEDIKGCTDFSMLNNNDFCFAGYHSLLARAYKKINERFFMYLFMSEKWGNQIKSRVNGVKVYSITQSILYNTDILVPPLDIQNEIAEFLDKKLLVIPKMIQIKKSKIEEYKKLKQSLIYELVTGKKEVSHEYR